MKNSLPFLLSMLCASVALAEPPAAPAPATGTQRAASALVEAQLVQPLRKTESGRKRFSRMGPVARERRVRILDAVARTDARGKRFVRFAIDVRYPWDDAGTWQQDAVVGCAYPAEKQVYVQRDADYLPARSALGKQARPKAQVCRQAADDGTQLASAKP